MEELGTLRRMTPPEEYRAAQTLAREGAAHFLREEEGQLVYAVGSAPRQAVFLTVGETPSGRCACGAAGICRHIAAAALEALSSGRMELARRRRAEEDTAHLKAAMGSLLPEEVPLVLEVTLHLPGEGQALQLSLRTGQERLYVVRSIPQFLEAIEDGRSISLGKTFSVVPSWARYGEADRALLALIGDIVLLQRLSGQCVRTGAQARLVGVPARYEQRLLKTLSGRPLRVRAAGREVLQRGIAEGQVELLFSVGLHGLEIDVRAQAPAGLQRADGLCRYVFDGQELLRLPQEQQAVLLAMRGAQARFCFGPEERPYVMAQLLPQLQRAGHVTLEGRLKDKLVNRPLAVEARLDRQNMAVTCALAFRYGEVTVDPFQPERGTEGDRIMLRDAEGERRALDALAAYGFRMRGGQAVLMGSERIWRFLTEGVPQLQALGTVYLSEAFRRIRPRRPSLAGRLYSAGHGLRLDLTVDGEVTEDAESILRALREKRTWVRLPDGAYLDLSELAQWQDIADAALEQERLEVPQRGALEIRAYRAAYLLSLLGAGGAPVEVDEETRRRYAATEGQPCPEPLGSRLRAYQKRGFEWLQSLYSLRMGGVLADDMGLGKTIQVIALLYWARQAEGRAPSVVVAPTSLLYNWQAEIRRFAPDLSVRMADGALPAREAQIEALRAHPEETDVLLTSYPLLRRDIEMIEDVPFRFAVLDEAQYIKNAASAGSAAVRRLRAQTRLALTGTPMENHPGELWSIFDYVLPGYLGSFAAFMHRYGGGEELDSLRRRVRPFLLRRLKHDVLEELPEKTENVMTAEMTPEQERVYRAALQRLRPAQQPLSGGGRFRVLAALTELRECCCHPALILPDYAGSSGKLELLMDVLPGAVAGGHRALIFSQFTRMLRIIEQRLTASGIDCFYLDGDTPARERLDRVNHFNGGEGQVFLISLKAGGSGLNLTGADWVIHFDPWWNPAAEDQATDRAHRIGQRRPVTVTRLVTRNTIEEQVVRLGEAKRQLFDRMIEAGESFPLQLTDEEIRSLFAE